MFAEFSIEPSHLLICLNSNNKYHYFYSPTIGCEKIHIFTRFKIDFIQPIYESERLTIRHLTLPGLLDIILAINHFPSKLYWEPASQSLECVALADTIKYVENQVGHSRTVLVGDLNMNPFEDGVVGASGLHAVMSRTIAKKGSRIVQSKQYPFFYNPMWNFFGDATPGPPGTYYYDRSEHKVYFWNIFDQVLIRPELIDFFDNDEMKIIESDGEISFVTHHGFPDVNNISDHLPIFFKLNL